MSPEKFLKTIIEGGYPDEFALMNTHYGIPQNMMLIALNRVVLDPKAWESYSRVVTPNPYLTEIARLSYVKNSWITWCFSFSGEGH